MNFIIFMADIELNKSKMKLMRNVHYN